MISYFGGILFLAFAVLQASVVGQMAAALRLKPDLMLLLVISWCLARSARETLGFAFLGGLVLDLLTNAPLGANAVALTVVAAAIGLTQEAISRHGSVIGVLVVFPASVLHGLVLLIILRAVGTEVAWLPSFGRLLLPTALLNVTVMPVVYLGARGVGRFLHHEVPVER